ncbi:uncharacterized protein LOC134405665 [Elgaria multicarinata webbii]|uniref:uncharacterized protein LOC134405665 n=1 Tax=Elgaria multicarinata webbii TaxID=159646 RepID=UPI002FCCE7D7
MFPGEVEASEKQELWKSDLGESSQSTAEENENVEKERIKAVLDKLGCQDFETLKSRILASSYEKKNIPEIFRIELKETNTSSELVDLLVQQYGKRTMMVLVEILRKMRRADLADDLKKLKLHGRRPVWTNPLHFGDAITLRDFSLHRNWTRNERRAFYSKQQYFIEMHQEELIHRVSRLDAVLRRLPVEHSQIMEGSDQQKMKELYKLVPKWDWKQKVHLYTVLKKTNGPLIAELEEGHFVERHKQELIKKVPWARLVVQFAFCKRLCCAVCEIAKAKEQMEDLYEMLPAWNGELKNHLYQMLRVANEPLIKELEGRKSSKEGLIPDPLAEEKCYLCEKEKDCPEVQPDLVLDAGRKLNRIHFPKAGTFLCAVTELKFEVRAAVTVEYKHDSWGQHLSESEKRNWMVVGPLFDIRADPAGEVAAVHLPHFMCLRAGNIDTSRMKIAHFIDAGISLEEPSRVSPFHAVLENPKFSLLGLLIKPIFNKFFPIHSVVQLYQTRKKTTTLHLYLIPNDTSLIEATKVQEERFHSRQVWKHPQTDEPLYIGSRYQVSSSAELTINPKELELSYKYPEQLQSFAEVYLGNRERVNLHLKKKNNLCSIWDALMEQEDLPSNSTDEEVNQKDLDASGPGTRKKVHVPRKTMNDCLLNTLENLREYELKRFKSKLNEFHIEGYQNIPQRKLETADALDLSKQLISNYKKDCAVDVVICVLEAINLNQEADNLRAAAGITTKSSSSARLQSMRKISGSAPTREQSHSQLAKEDLEKEMASGTASRGSLDSVMVIRKGRKHITEIIEKDLRYVLDELFSQSVITEKEHEDLYKMEEDSNNKSRRLLLLIQRKGEAACGLFLECLEIVYPGSNHAVRCSINGQDQNPVQTIAHLELQSESSPGAISHLISVPHYLLWKANHPQTSTSTVLFAHKSSASSSKSSMLQLVASEVLPCSVSLESKALARPKVSPGLSRCHPCSCK